MAVTPEPELAAPDRRFELALRLAAFQDPELVLDETLAEVLAGLGADHAMIAFRRLRALGEHVRFETVNRYKAAGPDDEAERHEAFGATLRALEGGAEDREGRMCVALEQRGHVVGALYVSRNAAFSPEDLTYVQDVSRLLGLALVNTNARHDAEERLSHLERLNRVFLTISHNLDLAKVQDMVLQMTMELTKAERAVILLNEEGQLVFTAGRDRHGPLMPDAEATISRSTCQKVMESLERVIVFNTGDDEALAKRHSVLGMQLKSILAVPLVGSSGPVGVLYVDSRNEMPASIEQDLLVLGAIAGQATILIENARLLRQATVDGLTNLYIRSYFMNRLAEEARRTLRYGGCFSLLVVDVDHFKRINDTYGHQTGDVALQQVAGRIATAVRVGIDLVGRYGGEEMVVLLPATDTPGAEVAAERIRDAIAGLPLATVGGVDIFGTVSIGVATLPAAARSAEDLFAAADRALYIAKNDGRNRVVVAPETP
ncbi:MAG: diguanylate cyclase [Cyanobacteria bacterium RYN_339]|nr:diguanylate cyclase [Cyanobacteria bacterium RYN_339]